ncbi:MAG TPA: LTA synthase family protein [Erysipelotrichaceae bacterium]|nr:LTA synthase family protein [Erysipelotrichaceae bacterium]
MEKFKTIVKSPQFKILGLFVLTITYLELILRVTTQKVFFNVGLFYILLNSIILALLLTIISLIFKNKGLKIYVFVVVALLILLFNIQKIYLSVSYTYLTLYSIFIGARALQFIDVVITGIIRNSLFIILSLLPLFIIFKLSKKASLINKHKVASGLALTLSLVLLFFTNQLILGIDESSYDNYYYNQVGLRVVDNFGLLTYMRLDAQNLLEKNGDPDLPPIIIDKDPVIIDKDVDYNVLDIDFDKLINDTSDDALNNMHQYFSQIAPTNKNEMTGVFEGYNVISITAEGFSNIAVHPEVTPTLYKLVNEGVKFNNFYNPIWGVSTSDGEYAHMTGLIPKAGVWSMREVANNYMPYVLGMQHKPLGYKTMAYHNHTYTFYDRHLTYPSFDYTYKGLGSGLDVEFTWPESDVEMMELSVDDYIHNEPFSTYYMTVSGHMNYTWDGNFISSKNKHLVDHLNYSDNAKAYLASQIELDLALEYLLNRLEEKGVLDKTLIVLVGDHYPYGLPKEDFDNLAGHEVEENFEIYKSNLIIYNNQLPGVVVDDYTYTLDILPTISNMLGLEYDSRLLMGRDVFSKSEPLVIFNDKSFITDLGFYNANTKEFIPNDGVNIPEGYVNKMKKVVASKFIYSSLIIDMDYYKHVYD